MTAGQASHEVAGATQAARRWPSPPDPGDLSRRLMARRADLRLSLRQVAARARVDVRYLEYLENFPGQPDADTLRRLAASLRTTPSALLGAGAAARAGASRERRGTGQLRPLTLSECRRLLEPGGIGRIAFATASGLIVLPVNYVMAAGSILVRTSAGSVIAAHADGPVSFEADRTDFPLGQGWSVLVLGTAHRVLQPGELRRLRASCDLRPWPAGEHELFVRIVPGKVTGRRIQSQ
jgi:transcriptional regulator with XRE-family HTH domain